MEVNAYRVFHICHTWIVFYAEEGNVGTKLWRALEPTEGKPGLGVSKREMSPRLLCCCCQISVLKKKVSYRREEGGDVLTDENDSGKSGVVSLFCHATLQRHICISYMWTYICMHIYTRGICISVCILVYPSLLFSTRINLLNPKKNTWYSSPISFEDICRPITHSVN